MAPAIVHMAPAFGEDDFRVGVANGLFDPTDPPTLFNPVRRDGTYDDRVLGYEGRSVVDPALADDLIEELRARGLLFRVEMHEHSYPHCWRCGTRLLYYAKPSWYIATSRLRDRLLAANETVDWHPPHIKHGRFGDWLAQQRRLGALPRTLLGDPAADLALRAPGIRRRASARSPSSNGAREPRSATRTAPTSTS